MSNSSPRYAKYVPRIIVLTRVRIWSILHDRLRYKQQAHAFYIYAESLQSPVSRGGAWNVPNSEGTYLTTNSSDTAELKGNSCLGSDPFRGLLLLVVFWRVLWTPPRNVLSLTRKSLRISRFRNTLIGFSSRVNLYKDAPPEIINRYVIIS